MKPVSFPGWFIDLLISAAKSRQPFPCKSLLVATGLLVFSITIRAQTDTRKLKGEWLGQKPPGKIAEIFAPGIVSTDAYEHSAPAFSPEGDRVIWTIVPRGRPSYFLEMKMENGVWTKPAPPSFADSTADDIYASFSDDGKKLYFCSRRKLPAGYPAKIGTRIWEVERKGNDWGKPEPFDTTVSAGNCFAHALTHDGTIYFSASGSGGTNWNIFRAVKSGGHYAKPEILPYNINGFGYEDGPFISPDGSFLIFESDRPDGIEGSIDLYISFKAKGGKWTVPVNMGKSVNSKYTERFARVSPDGKYLFFGSDRRQSSNSIGADIYWMDAGIINELRGQAKNRTLIDNAMGVELLSALEVDNYRMAAGTMRQWITDHPEDISSFLDYCVVLRKNDQYKDAEKLLKAGLADRPDDGNLQTEFVLDLIAQEKNEEAERYISSSIQDIEKRKQLYINLAAHYLKANKNKESASYFEKALALGQDGYSYYRLAYAYTKENETDKAIEALENSVRYGYPSKQQLEGDPGLRPLREDTRFKKLIEKAK